MKLPRLRQLRETAERTQQEIALMLNCHREVYGRYERGEQELHLSMLIKLANYYNTSSDYILGLTNKQERQ